MLLLLGLLGGANSILLVSSINTLLTYLQVKSSLLFTSNNTFACMVWFQVLNLNNETRKIKIFLESLNNS